MVISNQIKGALMPGLAARFNRLYERSPLGAVKEKRMRMYYGRAGGYWALREGMKRW
jgi:hypothetical protein